MKTNSDAGIAADGGGRRRLQRKIVQEFRAWIHRPGTLDAIYGPDTSFLEKNNEMRSIMGLAPLTRADIPPGEDWETVEPRCLIGTREREAMQREILGLGPDDEDEDELIQEP